MICQKILLNIRTSGATIFYAKDNITESESHAPHACLHFWNITSILQ